MARESSIFKKIQVLRLPRLLDMMYKPSEIADELEVTFETVRKVYIPAGAPVVKDATGHLWINGVAFREWAKTRTRKALKIGSQNKDEKRKKLPENKAYCVSCRDIVDFSQISCTPMHRGANMLIGICPVCGKKVCKLVSSKKDVVK